MDRRRFLAVAGCAAGTGCLRAIRSSPTTESVRPTDDPERIPQSLTCDEAAAVRVGSPYDESDIAWGDTGTFALRVNGESFERGESAQFRLRNTASEPATTGAETKNNFELRTESGWQDVRVVPDGTPKPHVDIGVQHEPGEGFVWAVELTESGVGDAPAPDNAYRVCPGLPAGRYRFVYWGTDDPVAVAFDLRDRTDTATGE